MMKPIVDGHGVVVFEGQDASRDVVLDAARTHLIVGKGRHHLDVDDVLADRQGLVVAAWWGGDDVGFVGFDHESAVPVTVVNLPSGWV